jgi:hypothetical protein
MDRERDSLSPSCFGEEDYDTFEDQTAQAGRAKPENAANRLLMTIEGSVSYADGRSGSFPFRNLRALNNIANPVPGNPGICYGAQPEQLCRSIGKDFSNLVENQDGRARTITSTYQSKVLQFYTCQVRTVNRREQYSTHHFSQLHQSVFGI